MYVCCCSCCLFVCLSCFRGAGGGRRGWGKKWGGERRKLKKRANRLSAQNKYSRTLIIQTSIIRISRLSGLFLWSQFCHEYLLVMIEIRRHSLFKSTALKSEVKASLFRFEKAKAAPVCVVTNEEHSNEVWLAFIFIFSIIRALSSSLN